MFMFQCFGLAHKHKTTGPPLIAPGGEERQAAKQRDFPGGGVRMEEQSPMPRPKGTRPQFITTGGFQNPGLHNQCTAMSKRSGVRCKGPAVAGSSTQKCRMHGAHPVIGADVHGFKDGRYSKHLPSNLDKLYREALSNPDLIEMSDHIALLEARMQEVLAVTAAGSPAPTWSEVEAAFGVFETELLSGNMEKAIPAMEAIHKMFEDGIKWDRAWKTVTDTMEQLRKMTDTEVKRKKELNQMVPIERVVILMAAVGQAVKRHVTDPAQIQAVYNELAILHGTNSAPARLTTERVGPEVIDVKPSRRRRLTAEAADAATS